MGFLLASWFRGDSGEEQVRFGVVVEVTPWTTSPWHEVATCWLGHWLCSEPERTGRSTEVGSLNVLYSRTKVFEQLSLREGREGAGGRRSKALASGVFTGLEEWR